MLDFNEIFLYVDKRGENAENVEKAWNTRKKPQKNEENYRFCKILRGRITL